jgi:hypothetical protein
MRESALIQLIPAKESLPAIFLRRTMTRVVTENGMRISIYKSFEAPDVTLLVREGFPVPLAAEEQKWRHIKSVTNAEVRADLLTQIEIGGGCVFVRLNSLPFSH